MLAPLGLVYSTKPQMWVDDAGVSRIVKGPDLNVVAAEAIAYLLAERLSLRTPDFAIATIQGSPGTYFASRTIENCLRDVSPLIIHRPPLRSSSPNFTRWSCLMFGLLIMTETWVAFLRFATSPGDTGSF